MNTHYSPLQISREGIKMFSSNVELPRQKQVHEYPDESETIMLGDAEPCIFKSGELKTTTLLRSEVKCREQWVKPSYPLSLNGGSPHKN